MQEDEKQEQELNDQANAQAEEEAYLKAMADEEDDMGTGSPDQETAASQEDDATTNDLNSNDQSNTGETENPKRVEVFKGFTAEELDERLNLIPTLQKTIDTQNGTYGRKFQQLERTITQLQEQRAGTTQEQQKPNIEIKADSFKKLKESGLEDLAADLAEDIGALLSGNTASPGVTEDKIQQIIDERLGAITKSNFDRDLDALNETHPDWTEIATYDQHGDNGPIMFRNPDFANYVVQLSPDVQQKLIQSDDPYLINKILTGYKKTLAESQNNQGGGDDVIKEGKGKNKAIRNAIQPRGTTASRQMTEKQEEDEAYKRAMAGEDY